MKTQLVEYTLDCLWTGISHFLSLDLCYDQCYRLVCFKVLSATFTLSVLTSMVKDCLSPQAPFSLAQSRDPRIGKNNLFSQGFVQEYKTLFFLLSLFSGPPLIFCVYVKEKETCIWLFFICEWQQRMDFDSNSQTSTLNNWYFNESIYDMKVFQQQITCQI